MLSELYKLACAYFLGEDGHQQDLFKAVELCAKAAEAGLAEAENFMGELFEKHSKAIDEYFRQLKLRAPDAKECAELATYWYRKAALQDEPNALYNLARCYRSGYSSYYIPEDIKKKMDSHPPKMAKEYGYHHYAMPMIGEYHKIICSDERFPHSGFPKAPPKSKLQKQVKVRAKIQSTLNLEDSELFVRVIALIGKAASRYHNEALVDLAHYFEKEKKILEYLRFSHYPESDVSFEHSYTKLFHKKQESKYPVKLKIFPDSHVVYTVFGDCLPRSESDEFDVYPTETWNKNFSRYLYKRAAINGSRAAQKILLSQCLSYLQGQNGIINDSGSSVYFELVNFTLSARNLDPKVLFWTARLSHIGLLNSLFDYRHGYIEKEKLIHYLDETISLYKRVETEGISTQCQQMMCLEVPLNNNLQLNLDKLTKHEAEFIESTYQKIATDKNSKMAPLAYYRLSLILKKKINELCKIKKTKEELTKGEGKSIQEQIVLLKRQRFDCLEKALFLEKTQNIQDNDKEKDNKDQDDLARYLPSTEYFTLDAYTELAAFYEKNSGVAHDLSEAECEKRIQEYLQEPIKAGHTLAHYRMGLWHERSKDMARAHEMYKFACKKAGHEELGPKQRARIYYRGALSYGFLKLETDVQGDPALFSLDQTFNGFQFLDTEKRRVEPDHTVATISLASREASHWFTKAANNGHSLAMRELALFKFKMAAYAVQQLYCICYVDFLLKVLSPEKLSENDFLSNIFGMLRTSLFWAGKAKRQKAPVPTWIEEVLSLVLKGILEHEEAISRPCKLLLFDQFKTGYPRFPAIFPTKIPTKFSMDEQEKSQMMQSPYPPYLRFLNRNYCYEEVYNRAMADMERCFTFLMCLHVANKSSKLSTFKGSRIYDRNCVDKILEFILGQDRVPHKKHAVKKEDILTENLEFEIIVEDRKVDLNQGRRKLHDRSNQ